MPATLGLPDKAVALAVYIFTIVVMATFVHLSWEPVGAKTLDGIQPRYFLPILPLLLLLPRGGERLTSSRWSRTIVPAAAIVVTILAAACTAWTLWVRYYW